MRSVSIPSQHILLCLHLTHVLFFLLSVPPSLPSPKSMLWASVLASVGRAGGQQVEHKHTCLPHLLYLPSWGCRAEGPISSPSEPCNQHCQAHLPVEHTGLTLQTVCGETGQAGRPPGCCCCAGGKHGARQTTTSLSWGSTWLEGPEALRHRGMNRSRGKSSEATWMCSVLLNCDFWSKFHFQESWRLGVASRGSKFSKLAWVLFRNICRATTWMFKVSANKIYFS